MPKYLLRPGTLPGIPLWSRCEDELLCRAELVQKLLKLVGKVPGEDEEKAVFGYYDVDPRVTVARFKAAYRGRSNDYRALMASRQDIIDIGWPYPEALGGVGK